MPKPRHMNPDVSKVDVQIVDMSYSFPGLFDMPEAHRQMEPVKNMRYGLTCCADHDALQANFSVAKDSNVAARQPSLRSHRRTNDIVLAAGHIRRSRELTRRPWQHDPLGIAGSSYRLGRPASQDAWSPASLYGSGH